MTAESPPSKTRVIELSHANRCTVFAEMGSESAISPAGAPIRPCRVSNVVVI